MGKRGHLKLDPEVHRQLLRVSAATIDRILAPVRATAVTRRRRRGRRPVAKWIPIKTFADWNDPAPGFLEIDLLVPGGGSMAGEHLHSFVATPPATPCDRLLALAAVPESTKERLREQRDRLDPVELRQPIRQGQSALAALAKGDPSDGPQREGLDEFLAGLPELWRQREARPTHRKPEAKLRYWRTRVDPLREVWTDIRLLRQQEPDVTAMSVLARLEAPHPGKLRDDVLRTLQRRISEAHNILDIRCVLENAQSGQFWKERALSPQSLAEAA